MQILLGTVVIAVERTFYHLTTTGIRSMMWIVRARIMTTATTQLIHHAEEQDSGFFRRDSRTIPGLHVEYATGLFEPTLAKQLAINRPRRAQNTTVSNIGTTRCWCSDVGVDFRLLCGNLQVARLILKPRAHLHQIPVSLVSPRS